MNSMLLNAPSDEERNIFINRLKVCGITNVFEIKEFYRLYLNDSDDEQNMKLFES